MKKLVPLLCLIIGLAVGVGSGLSLGLGKKDCSENECEEVKKTPKGLEYFKLNNQFIVPVVKEERVQSLVVMSLSLETTEGSRESIFSKEPKLRDAFLQVLFDHAYTGGFDGRFTDGSRLDTLRKTLTKVARDIVGPDISSVLITDLVRQEVG